MQRDAAVLYPETSLIGEPLPPPSSAPLARHSLRRTDKRLRAAARPTLFNRIVRASLHADTSAPRLTLTVYDTLCVPIDPASAGTRAPPRTCCSFR
jgi:hypothetical protein